MSTLVVTRAPMMVPFGHLVVLGLQAGQPSPGVRSSRAVKYMWTIAARP